MTLQEQYQSLILDGNTIRLPYVLLPDYGKIKKTLQANQGRYHRNSFIFDYDPSPLLEALCQGLEVNMKKDYHFFATPPEGCDFLLQAARPIGSRVLEPSAGHGALAQAIIDFAAGNTVDCVELHPINRNVLKKKGLNLVGEDFLDLHPEEWSEGELYDMVIANPPFKDYHDHFWQMLKCVKPDGQVWLYVPASIQFRQDKKTARIREYLDAHDGEILEAPRGTFKASGTMVETRVIGVTRPSEGPSGVLPGEQISLL